MALAVVLVGGVLLWWRPWFKDPATVTTKCHATFRNAGWLVLDASFSELIVDHYSVDVVRDGWEIRFWASRRTFTYDIDRVHAVKILDRATGRPPTYKIAAYVEYDGPVRKRIERSGRDDAPPVAEDEATCTRLSDEAVHAFLDATR